MHVAHLLQEEKFRFVIDGAAAQMDAVFPGWGPLDRFGIVIDEPLGGVGASHLIQTATMAFYKARPARKHSLPTYPEIYAFHHERYWGAHAVYDFWPPRKEVPAAPGRLLDEINAHAITFLAAPQGFKFPIDVNSFEKNAFIDRVRRVFEYSPTGSVQNPDLCITGVHGDTEYNFTQATESYEAILKRYTNRNIALTTNDEEYLAWLKVRRDDIDADVRLRRRTQRDELRTAEGVMETYMWSEPIDIF